MVAFLKNVVPILLSLGIIVVMVRGLWPEDEIVQPVGVIAKSGPRITKIFGLAPFKQEEFSIKPIGKLVVDARILARRKYWYAFGLNMFAIDKYAAVSPMDVLIGWGELSNELVLEKYNFYMGGREFTWKPDDINDRPKVTRIVNQSCTMLHLIPANKAVEEAIDQALVGSLIAIEGLAVDVEPEGGSWSWQSDLAKEKIAERHTIVWVEKLTVKTAKPM